MSVWDKIKNIMVIPDEDDYENEAEETERPVREKSYDEPAYTPKKEAPAKLIKSKTINYSQNSGGLQVVLVKPDRYEDVTSIADHLNAKKTVVLNLEAANRDVSRRIIDFLSGVAYANGGNIRKVANSTFIIVPTDVDVMGELMLDDFDDSSKDYF